MFIKPACSAQKQKDINYLEPVDYIEAFFSGSYADIVPLIVSHLPFVYRLHLFLERRRLHRFIFEIFPPFFHLLFRGFRWPVFLPSFPSQERLEATWRLNLVSCACHCLSLVSFLTTFLTTFPWPSLCCSTDFLVADMRNILTESPWAHDLLFRIHMPFLQQWDNWGCTSPDV